MYVIPRILGYVEMNIKIEYSRLPVMRRGLEFGSCTLETDVNLLLEYLKLE
jgi:hypothetical protein